MKIPKQPKSTTVKVRKICRQYLNEFGETPASDLQSNFCDVLIKCDKKLLMEIHRKSKLHQAKLVTTSSFQGEQTYIQLHRTNFKEKVVSSFLATDIPLHKLNYPAAKSLFVAIRKPLPSETAAPCTRCSISISKRGGYSRTTSEQKSIFGCEWPEVDKQKYIFN